MTISVITLFPELFIPFLSTSILGRAQNKGLVQYKIVNIRQFGEGKHQVVDDRPFGGGVGMVLKPDILAEAWKSVADKKQKTILMSASGKPFNQSRAQQFSQFNHLIIVCGHYEGVDQRFIDKYVDEEVSIGDFVLTGGEIPALAVIDATVRLIPQVLEKSEAVEEESFSIIGPNHTGKLLEYPQYTRPDIFEGKKVPGILLSGNHQKIEKWRKEKALEKTKQIRPDLLG